jgi:hypothetical protein
LAKPDVDGVLAGDLGRGQNAIRGMDQKDRAMTTNPDIELPPLPQATPVGQSSTVPMTIAAAPATDQLAAALAKAQGQMHAAKFDATNPYFKSRYATLNAIIEASRKPLSDNGLSITQPMHINSNGIMLHATMLHTSGQSVLSEYPLPPIEVAIKEPQKFGAALTYARRYTWAALCGISAMEDDDAEAAMERKITPQQVELLQIAIDAKEDGTEQWLLGSVSGVAGKEIAKLEDIPAELVERAFTGVKNRKNKKK